MKGSPSLISLANLYSPFCPQLKGHLFLESFPDSFLQVELDVPTLLLFDAMVSYAYVPLL